jgi:hypothetical protein
MPSVARLLRTQLILPRFYWVTKAIGAAITAIAAYACFGHAQLPALVCAALAAALALEAADSVSAMLIVHRARQRAHAGGCARCGYPLPGLTSLNCPECGPVRRATCPCQPANQ